jgi:hypothetical protein
MIYMSDPNGNLIWDEATETVIIEGWGFAKGEQVQAFMEKALEVIKERKATRYMVDLQRLSLIPKETEDWISQNWFPRAMAAGIKSFAFVIPTSALGRLSTNSVISKIPGTDREIGKFDSQFNAKRWLMSRVSQPA